MSAQGKKTVIELPLKVILTDAGTTFFINNKKTLKKFKLADNVEEYGIFLDKFTPPSLQRLIMIDYVNKIELATTEFLRIRQEVMDLTKLITYSMLYRQFDGYVFQQVMASELIKNWNRKNPSNIIDEKTKINDQTLQTWLRSKYDELETMKESVLAPMHAFITKNTNLQPDEKNVQLLLSEKFLNNLRPFVWFILNKFKELDGYEELLKKIRTTLAEYMEKAKLGEFLALNVMELVTNAENSNLKREAKTLFKGTVDINSVLFDPGIRRQVMESLKQKGDVVYVSWKLGSRGASIGIQGKLTVTIYNKESQYEKMRETIDEKKSADLKKKSLTDFYKELPQEEANTELGLYYLSYLSEACEKVNVKFESFVNQVSGSDLTVITLVLNI